ncbi:MAG: major capsid protein [Azoarcus sp.]|jgi:hypothetical protein|nr:major capsid protein [Azoarcus sp.]
MLNKKLAVVVAPLVALSASANAADLADLTDAVDFTAVSTAVLAVGASLAGVYVLWKGASLILRAIRGL